MTRMVIALSGWKGSGKDTAADYLVAAYGFRKVSLAARLKDLVAQQYGVPREDLDSPAKKEMPLVHLPVISSDRFSETIHLMLRDELSSGFWTPRALCILEGSSKRAVHSNYWVRSVVEQILNDSATNYVIPDLRYVSEADIFKLLLPNIQLIRLERWNNIATSDPSERDLDSYKFNYTLVNQGVKELLYDQVDGCIDIIQHLNR